MLASEILWGCWTTMTISFYRALGVLKCLSDLISISSVVFQKTFDNIWYMIYIYNIWLGNVSPVPIHSHLFWFLFGFVRFLSLSLWLFLFHPFPAFSILSQRRNARFPWQTILGIKRNYIIADLDAPHVFTLLSALIAVLFGRCSSRFFCTCTRSCRGSRNVHKKESENTNITRKCQKDPEIYQMSKTFQNHISTFYEMGLLLFLHQLCIWKPGTFIHRHSDTTL